MGFRRTGRRQYIGASFFILGSGFFITPKRRRLFNGCYCRLHYNLLLVIQGLLLLPGQSCKRTTGTARFFCTDKRIFLEINPERCFGFSAFNLAFNSASHSIAFRTLSYIKTFDLADLSMPDFAPIHDHRRHGSLKLLPLCDRQAGLRQ